VLKITCRKGSDAVNPEGGKLNPAVNVRRLCKNNSPSILFGIGKIYHNVRTVLGLHTHHSFLLWIIFSGNFKRKLNNPQTVDVGRNIIWLEKRRIPLCSGVAENS